MTLLANTESRRHKRSEQLWTRCGNCAPLLLSTWSQNRNSKILVMHMPTLPITLCQQQGSGSPGQGEIGGTSCFPLFLCCPIRRSQEQGRTVRRVREIFQESIAHGWRWCALCAGVGRCPEQYLETLSRLHVAVKYCQTAGTAGGFHAGALCVVNSPSLALGINPSDTRTGSTCMFLVRVPSRSK